MSDRDEGNVRLLRDLLDDALVENLKQRQLIAMLRLENLCLRHKATSFELSADSELPCLLRRQANQQGDFRWEPRRN